MYTLIGLLYNERGMFKGARFFQWTEKIEKFVNLEEDKAIWTTMRRETVSIAQSRVVELSLSQLLMYGSALQFYRYGSDGYYMMGNCGNISRILADGSVVEDTVTVLYSLFNSSVIVVDHNGKWKVFNKDVLIALCDKLSINLDVKSASELLYALMTVIRNKLEYATYAFKERLNVLIAQGAIYGMNIVYNEFRGEVYCELGIGGTVVVPDAVDNITVRDESGVIELVLPKECSLSCVSSILRKFKSSDVAYEFKLNVFCALSEFSLPKVIKKRELVNSYFELSTEEIPMNVTEIDQSKYDINSNTVSILGRNNLSKLKLVCPEGTKCRISYSEHLNSIDLLHPLSAKVADIVQLSLGAVSGLCVIRCHTSIKRLQLYLDKPETGIIILKCARAIHNIDFELNFSYCQWACTHKRLAVVVDNGVHVFTSSTDGSLNDDIVSLAQVLSDSEALNKAKSFISVEDQGGVCVVMKEMW